MATVLVKRSITAVGTWIKSNPSTFSGTTTNLHDILQCKLQEENGQKRIGIDRQETAPEHLFVISQDAVVDYLC